MAVTHTAGAPGMASLRTDQDHHQPDPYHGTGRVLASMRDDLVKWRDDAPNVPSGAGRDAMVQAMDALNGIGPRMQRAVADTERIRSDDTIAPEGRARQLGEHADTLGADIAAAAERVRTMARVAAAEFTVQAAGQVPPAQQQTARSDLRMLLDGTPAHHAPSALADLARRDDAVGWLAASPFGADYLRSRGTDENTIAAVTAAAAANALEAAAASEDQARASAAAVAKHMDALTGMADYAGSAARIAPAEIRTRNGLRHPARPAGNH